MPKSVTSLILIGAMLMTSPAEATRPLDLSLPDLGEPAQVALSPAKEKRLGKQIVAEMYQADYIVDDPQLASFLDSIGWKLAYYGSAQPPDFHFYPIADNDINAFALPGANIGVNVGTIVAADDESELAAVMAHEEAHVTQGHIARTANRSPIEDIATWAAVLAGILAARGDPNAVMGGILAGQSLNTQRAITYTRGHEMEADRIGIRTLARAGYDPMAMADFFGRLEQNTRLYGYVPQLLLDHPVNTTRIAEATERAAQYPPVHPKTSIDFELMRARARVLETDLSNDAVAYFSRELAAGKKTVGNEYGDAMALQQTGHDTKGLRALQPLLERLPHQRNVLLLQAELLAGDHHLQTALKIDREVLDANPRYAPAILQTARHFIDAGQPRRARQILLAHDQSYDTSPDTYRLLARAAQADNNIAETAYQMANYLKAKGDVFGAVDRIDAALRDANISADGRARLIAKRREIIAGIPADQLRRHRRDAQ